LPITVAAQVPGTVTISGEVSIAMTGEYVVLQGFIFKDGSQDNQVIQTRANSNTPCNHCRITENSLINMDAGMTDTTKWVYIYGSDNRIDHNWFSGKTTRGALLVIDRYLADGVALDETFEVDRAQIDHNYFGDRPPVNGKPYADSSVNEQEQPAPQWFVKAVMVDFLTHNHNITIADGSIKPIVINANPMDEINEAWGETKIFFWTIVFMSAIIFLTINFVFNSMLRAVNTILYVLRQVEGGYFDQVLPPFKISEFNAIAVEINGMSNALNTARKNNQALALRTMQIQETERKDMSRELHDEMGQSLTAIKAMAVTCQQPSSDVSAITSSIINICDHLSVVVRSMMKTLHPLSLNSDIAIHVYRIVQECLTNVVKHANASKVNIVVIKLNNEVKISISDNGQGKQSNSPGFGLLGMRERAENLGGTFSLETPENSGVNVVVQLPFRGNK
jgi:two-component system sensor histidine kinase UhpB